MGECEIPKSNTGIIPQEAGKVNLLWYNTGMETMFFIVCLIAGFALSLAVSFGISRVIKQEKCPSWVPEAIGAVLAIAGLFAGAWFADAYKQYIIDQAQENQYEQCVELLNS